MTIIGAFARGGLAVVEFTKVSVGLLVSFAVGCTTGMGMGCIVLKLEVRASLEGTRVLWFLLLFFFLFFWCFIGFFFGIINKVVDTAL